jgi:hypothetical protein
LTKQLPTIDTINEINSGCTLFLGVVSMGCCSSSSSVGLSPSGEELEPKEVPKQTVENAFLRAILEQDHDQLRDLIRNDGSKLIAPVAAADIHGQDFFTAVQTLIIIAFQKIIEFEENAFAFQDKESPVKVYPESIQSDPVLSGSESQPVAVAVAPVPSPPGRPEKSANVGPVDESCLVAESVDKFALHTAARVGDIDEVLFLCVHGGSSGHDRLWIRDEFDNIPLYYTCLNGHPLCCAWLLLAMRGHGSRFAAEVPPIEMERFVVNALNSDIKALLKEQVDCKGMGP